MEQKERYRPGLVRDAIVEVLASDRRAMGAAEITRRASELLGSPVPNSSIRSYLALNEGGAFDRVSRGQYVLRGMDIPAGAADEAPVFTWKSARLYRGECVSWLREQPANSFHAVVTDPPYGLVEYEQGQLEKMKVGSGGVWRIPPSFDGHERSPVPRFTTLTPTDRHALGAFFQNWARALLPVLVPGAHVVIATNPLLSYLVAGALASVGFERRGEIVRLVMTMRGGDRPKNAHNEFDQVTVMPRSMWEPWLLFRKPIEGRVQDNLRTWRTGGLRRPSADRPFGDVIASHPTRPAEKKLAAHPTLKPQDFLRQIVRAALPLGEGVILDPFAGSGSTLAAAEVCGYRSVGVELNDEYFELAKDAIPKLAAFRP